MSGAVSIPARGRPSPGPWRIYGPQPDTLGGRHLTILSGKGKARFGVADIRIINPNDALEASANAHLIAAAPDLYGGCNALLGLIQLVLHRDDLSEELREVLTTSHRIDEAELAVAKARGETA